MGGLTLTLEMTGATAVLVGGGAVASRKAAALRAADMRLTVIAPDLCGQLAQWAADGSITWRRRTYRNGDLAGAALVVAATGLREVNRQVALDARALGLPVNVADAPHEGTCRFPALLRRGGLTVAVTTAGRSPAFSVAIRDLLAAVLDESYGEALELLAVCREKLLTLGQTGTYNAPLIKELLAAGLVDLLRQGDRAAAEALIHHYLSEPGMK